MSLRVSGKNMDVGDALRGKAQGHIDAVVKKYFDGGYDGHLTLEPEGPVSTPSAPSISTPEHCCSRKPMVGMRSAYELLSDTIEKRLRRYNRKLRSHRHRAANGATAEAAEPAQSYVLAAPDDEEVEADFSPTVIAETTSHLNRMSVGEAVMQLDLSHGARRAAKTLRPATHAA